MSSSERKLLAAFLALFAVLGGALLVQQFRGWQHRIDRKERDAELRQIEASSLLAEAERWKACGDWLAQAQPAAQSDLEAEEGLLNTLQQSASDAGLTTKQTTPEPKQTTGYFRQFGFTVRVYGEVPALFRWLHSLQQPSAFYVVPLMRITPDKDDPSKVTAQVQIWRWYLPELAAAPAPEASPQPAPQ